MTTKTKYEKGSSNVLNECENKSIDIKAITTGIVSEIPVILATHIVEFFINPLIKLPEEISNINTIKNRVILTDCKFLQGANVLFIKGFVRKNIYYYTCNSSNASKTSGNLKHCLIHVPFECTTNVTLNSSMDLVNNVLKSHKENKELIFSNKNDGLLSNGLSEFNKISEEFFNSPPFCELVSSSITEQCKYIYKKDENNSSKPLDFKQIIELNDNMTIKLEIHVLQNCEVYIKPYSSHNNNENNSFNNENDSFNNEFKLENTASPEKESHVDNSSKHDDNISTSSKYDDNISTNKSDSNAYSSSNNHNSSLFEFLILALFILMLFSLNSDYFKNIKRYI